MTLFIRKMLVYGFGFEVLLFIFLYYFGPNGKHMIVKLAEEKMQVNKEIVLLKDEVDKLEYKIKYGFTPFAKEKIARERLHMKKDKEIIYFMK